VSAVSDARLRAATENWAGRLIANGVEWGDFVRITGSLARWEDWLEAWSATALEHERAAALAQESGHLLSAGEAFLRAAVSYHFAKFVWVVDEARHRAATEDAVRTLYAAHALVDPTAERVPVPFEGGSLVANLRRPGGAEAVSGAEAVPVVILLPGLDSTKEEFFAWESVFLARGMATLSLDGPGQGESGFTSSIRPDYEVAVAALLEAVSARSDLDLGRLGAVGVSLGGYYVARAAAFEPRLKAVAGVSGPYHMGEAWDGLPGLTREVFAFHSGAADESEARERAGRLSLDGVAERISQPFLVVTGARDRVIPWEQTQRIADEAPRGEWVLYEEGTHVCNNIPFKYRPTVADWMRDQLG
jgi:2,6-dihydroxypseudooxynicotine hydrolase